MYFIFSPKTTPPLHPDNKKCTLFCFEIKYILKFMDFSLLSPLEFFADPKNGDGRNNKPPAMRNIINLRKKWKGICSQVPFIVLKYRQGCI